MSAHVEILLTERAPVSHTIQILEIREY